MSNVENHGAGAVGPTPDMARLAELCKNPEEFRAADPGEIKELLWLLRERILNGVAPKERKTRAAARVTQAQVRNVVKAAMNAGLAVSRVETVNGKITVFAGEATAEAPIHDLVDRI